MIKASELGTPEEVDLIKWMIGCFSGKIDLSQAERKQ